MFCKKHTKTTYFKEFLQHACKNNIFYNVFYNERSKTAIFRRFSATHMQKQGLPFCVPELSQKCRRAVPVAPRFFLFCRMTHQRRTNIPSSYAALAVFFYIFFVLCLLDFVLAAIMIICHMLQDGGSHGIAFAGYSSPTFWPSAAAGNACTN